MSDEGRNREAIGDNVWESGADGRRGTIKDVTDDGLYFVVQWEDGVRDEVHIASMMKAPQIPRSKG